MIQDIEKLAEETSAGLRKRLQSVPFVRKATSEDDLELLSNGERIVTPKFHTNLEGREMPFSLEQVILENAEYDLFSELNNRKEADPNLLYVFDDASVVVGLEDGEFTFFAEMTVCRV